MKKKLGALRQFYEQFGQKICSVTHHHWSWTLVPVNYVRHASQGVNDRSKWYSMPQRVLCLPETRELSLTGRRQGRRCRGKTGLRSDPWVSYTLRAYRSMIEKPRRRDQLVSGWFCASYVGKCYFEHYIRGSKFAFQFQSSTWRICRIWRSQQFEPTGVYTAILPPPSSDSIMKMPVWANGIAQLLEGPLPCFIFGTSGHKPEI